MKLGDKEYTPRYPILSCIALEGALNKSLFQIIEEISAHRMPSVTILSAIIWAGILADEPKITQDEVLKLLENAEPGYFRSAYTTCCGVLIASAARLISGEEKEADEEGEKAEEGEKN